MSRLRSFPTERPAVPAGALPSSEMHTINPAATRPVNEIGRFVVKLPENATFYGDAHYVPIAFEASNDGCEARIVN